MGATYPGKAPTPAGNNRKAYHTSTMVPQLDTIIYPSDFNAIPDIHNQVDFPNDPTLVTALGDVFQKYDVHERFGLHLLHRHFILPENCLMLKSKVDAEISLTKITSLD